jgi:hypothetical protein
MGFTNAAQEIGFSVGMFLMMGVIVWEIYDFLKRKKTKA